MVVSMTTECGPAFIRAFFDPECAHTENESCVITPWVRAVAMNSPVERDKNQIKISVSGDGKSVSPCGEECYSCACT